MSVPDYLLNFCNEIIDHGFVGDIDGGSIQDIAERHGLLRKETMTERCSEVCSCADSSDFPTTCYRKTALLLPSLIECKGDTDKIDVLRNIDDLVFRAHVADLIHLLCPAVQLGQAVAKTDENQVIRLIDKIGDMLKILPTNIDGNNCTLDEDLKVDV